MQHISPSEERQRLSRAVNLYSSHPANRHRDQLDCPLGSLHNSQLVYHLVSHQDSQQLNRLGALLPSHLGSQVDNLLLSLPVNLHRSLFHILHLFHLDSLPVSLRHNLVGFQLQSQAGVLLDSQARSLLKYHRRNQLILPQ